MRPKSLEIEGLQSFRDKQKIDFDALGETGLFGIFGPTGSGKSTILDGITFALYGRVKRAERGTQGIINANFTMAKVAFTFELLKEGIRKTYRVERTYQRKKGSENSCEPKVARLLEITGVGDIPLCDKASEVTAGIEELIGLSHDDFTRAVVLPQNSFQEFLLLDNAKKREMLERIFYLEEYGKKLSDKLNSRISSLKSRTDRVSGELSAYEDASEEALAQAEKELNEAMQSRALAEKEMRRLEQIYKEAQEVWQLTQELDHFKGLWEEQLLRKDDIEEKRLRLDQAVRADALLKNIARVKELTERLAVTGQELGEREKLSEEVSEELNFVRTQYNNLNQEAGSEKPRLLTYQTRLTDALLIQQESKALTAKLEQIAQDSSLLKRAMEEKSAQQDKAVKEFQRLEQSLRELKESSWSLLVEPEYRQILQEGLTLEQEEQSIKNRGLELKEESDVLQRQIGEQEKQAQKFQEQLEQLTQHVHESNEILRGYEEIRPRNQQEIIRDKEEIHQLRVIYSELKLKKDEIDRVRDKLTQAGENLALSMELTAAGEEKREKTAGLWKECLRDKEALFEEINKNTAYILAGDLHEGQPCPVCGSENHPSPAMGNRTDNNTELELRLKQSEEKLTAADEAMRAAEHKYLVLQEQRKSQEEQQRQLRDELKFKETEYDSVYKRLPEEYKVLALPELVGRIEEKELYGQHELKLWEEYQAKIALHKDEADKLQQRLVALRLDENAILVGLNTNRELLLESDRKLTAERQNYLEKAQVYQDLLKQLQITGVSKELAALTVKDQKMAQLQKQIENTQGNLAEERILSEKQNAELQELRAAVIKLETEEINYQQQKTAKDDKLQELAGGAIIQEELIKVKSKLEEYKEQEETLKNRLAQAEAKYYELSAQKAALKNQQQLLKDGVMAEQEELQRLLAAKGFADAGEAEDAVLPEMMQKAFQEEILAFDQVEVTIQAQNELVRNKLGTRNINKEAWEQISLELREKVQLKENFISRSEVCKALYNDLKDKHAKWCEISALYGTLAHRMGLYEEIQKLLKAERGKDNSFIDYIAEERLRYVAARASETLGLMTRYKYALELDAEVGFIIRDNANGGIHRMVTSLSGGETFLTSLSLALALSEQIQLKGQSPLEFFFLDEGFGTLDNDLLDIVIDSLERLSSKERVVGLISHVPELKLRLSRRLIVTPPSINGEGSKVSIEKA